VAAGQNGSDLILAGGKEGTTRLLLRPGTVYVYPLHLPVGNLSVEKKTASDKTGAVLFTGPDRWQRFYI
jgi:hypothetical protein